MLVLGLFLAHFGLFWVVLARFRSPFGSFLVGFGYFDSVWLVLAG